MFRRYGASKRISSLIVGSPWSFTTSACVAAPHKKAILPEDAGAQVDKDETHRSKRQSEKGSASEELEVPLTGLLARQARLEQSLRRRTAYYKGKAARDAKNAANEAGVVLDSSLEQRRKFDEPSTVPPSQISKQHSDLRSFLEYAKHNNLKETTTVYKGTLFEYIVAEKLKPFGFELSRTGKSNDLGIDLLGVWKLPEEPHEMRVLIQCKVTKPTPATTRELEGAYAGAPSGWQGDNVLALLVSTKPSTKGVVTAVQRSTSPIGVAQIDAEGNLRQLLWNAVAEQRGLAGLGVTVKYSESPQPHTDANKAKDMVETIALTWKGHPLTSH